MAELLATGGSDLAGIAVSAEGTTFIASRGSGVILALEDSELIEWANTGGQPAGVVVDPKTGALFIADLAHGAIVSCKEEGGAMQLFVKDYEGTPLKGPSSLAFDGDGSLYFTDSGPLGESSLQSPTGSCYVITGGAASLILRPLALNCLAHPSGIAVSSSGAVFVAETLKNRILRFAQRPAGVFHASVFLQLAGRLGPTALALDGDDNLYVARYDFADVSAIGLVSVFDSTGNPVRDIEIKGAEISGLAISEDGLLITESSTNSVYNVPL